MARRRLVETTKGSSTDATTQILINFPNQPVTWIWARQTQIHVFRNDFRTVAGLLQQRGPAVRPGGAGLVEREVTRQQARGSAGLLGSRCKSVALFIGVYAHMVNNFLDLPDYPIGHLLAHQIEAQIEQRHSPEPRLDQRKHCGKVSAMFPTVQFTTEASGLFEEFLQQHSLEARRFVLLAVCANPDS